MVVHSDPSFGKGGNKIGLPGTPLPEQCFLEYSRNPFLLFRRDGDLVGAHPASKAGQGFRPANGQNPAKILTRNQLPSATEQMRPDNPAIVERFLECLERRPLCPHRHRPADHPVLLPLHRPEPRHNLLRFSELRTNQLLAQKSCGDGIHSDTILRQNYNKDSNYRLILYEKESKQNMYLCNECKRR